MKLTHFGVLLDLYHYFLLSRRGIGVIKKTSKYVDKSSLLMLYRTLVETHFRYCNIIWGKCNGTLKDKLQVLQNKVARIITKVKYEDADHLRLICQLGWLTVRNLIRLDMGIFMYKSQNNLLPETAGEFHLPADKIHSYQTRSAVSGICLCLDVIWPWHKSLLLIVAQFCGMKSQSI